VDALPRFHAKAVADTQARTEAAIDERNRADEFLSDLDRLLSEGFHETVEAY
jgi:hypothetical protein